METIECIKTRRSVRDYNPDAKIDVSAIKELVSIASWAPSGKNIQPWKVKIITDKEIIKSIAGVSVENRWISKTTCLLAVFLDKARSYDYVKDVQGCGAFIQTMLLAAHDMDIDSCWVGGIIHKSKEINVTLKVPEDFELMGIVTLGKGADKIRTASRRELNELLL